MLAGKDDEDEPIFVSDHVRVLVSSRERVDVFSSNSNALQPATNANNSINKNARAVLCSQSVACVEMMAMQESSDENSHLSQATSRDANDSPTQDQSSFHQLLSLSADAVHASKYDCACLAIGHCAFLFVKNTHAASISIDSPASCCAFNNDASFLAIGDASGIIHFVHVDSATVAISLNIYGLAASKGDFDATPAPIELISFVPRSGCEKVEEFVVVLQNQIQVHFRNIDFSLGSGLLHQPKGAPSTASITVTNLSKQSRDLVTGKILTILPFSGMGDFSTSSAEAPTLVVVSGKASLSTWIHKQGLESSSMTDIIFLQGITSNVLHAECDAFGRFLVLMDSNGHLSIWDYKRLVLLKKRSSRKIADFTIMPPNEQLGSAESGEISFNILTLLPASDNNGDRFMEVVSLPGFTVTNRIQVSRDSWLIKNGMSRGAAASSGGTLDFAECGMYYGERETDLKGNCTRIYLRCMRETNPMQKVNALIKRGHFDEAKNLALEYDLDMEYVLKEKLLQFISGDAVVTNESAGVVLADLKLMTVENRIAAADPASSQFYEELSIRVHAATHRLGTFQMLSMHDHLKVKSLALRLLSLETTNGASSDVGINAGGDLLGFDGPRWRQFQKTDLLEEIQKRLRVGDFRGYFLIWKRHCAEDALMNRLADLLIEIPDLSNMTDLIHWLESDVLPRIQSTELFLSIGDWILHKACSTEAFQKSPHDAFSLVSLLDPNKECNADIPAHQITQYQSLKPVTPACYIQSTLSGSHRGVGSYFGFNAWDRKKDYEILRTQLEDLVYLWDVHGFKLYLAEYQSSNPASIAIDLLDRVASFELLSDAMENHFKPYVLRHQLDFDGLLWQYCVEIMDRSAGRGKVLPGSHSETRVMAIAEHISNQDVKASLLLDIMVQTPIPWSESLDCEIVKALDRKHIKQVDMTEQYRLMRLKRTLFFHGLEKLNLSDVTKTKPLLTHILSNLDSPSAMKEAMQLVAIYPSLSKTDAYIIRIRNLFEAGHIQRALSLLETGHEYQDSDPLFSECVQSELEKRLDLTVGLEPMDQLTVGEKVFSWIAEVVESAVADEEKFGASKKTFIWAVKAGISLSSTLKKLKDNICGTPQTTQKMASFSTSTPIFNLIPSHLSALDMPNACCAVETTHALESMRDLCKEFDIRIGLHAYRHDDGVRRVILNKFAKEVFKYGVESKTDSSTTSEFSRTELYRLAELLGFERMSLDGIIAEEAARNGDVKTALLLCKELYEKSADVVSGQTLKNIALLLTSFSAENKAIFRDMKETKSDFRLTKWILELSQKSLAVCGEDVIGDCLDDFKNYEVQHSIFTQCDAGDYGTLLATGNANIMNPIISSKPSSSSSSSSSASSPGIGSTSSSFPVKWSVSSKLSDRALDVELSSVGDTYGSVLFMEHYREGGLVLPTEKAMGLVTDFILEIASSATQGLSGDLSENVNASPAKQKMSGKQRSAPQSSPVVSGNVLSRYLKTNRALVTAMRTLQRTLELRTRCMMWLTDDFMSDEDLEDDIERHMQLIKSFTENIFSSRTIDQNLAFGGLMVIPPQEAFESFKFGLSTTGKDYDRLLKFAAIGIAASLAWNQRTFQVTCETLAKNAKWWHQLHLLNVSFNMDQYKLSTSGEYQRRLVPALLEKTGLDIMTSLDFARTYNIEDDFVIFEYITQLLSSDHDSNGYKYRIAGILDDVDNKPRLATLLHEVCAKCSPYKYEKIGFIIDQILRLDPSDAIATKGRKVLDVLFNYASQTMRSKDLHNQSKDSAKMDETEQHRLPFHSVIRDGWAAFATHVNETTISWLLPLSSSLGLDPDQFYAAVIEGFVSRLVDSETGTKDASFGINDVKPYFIKLRDPHQAVKLSVALAEAFPCGVDRVAAFKLAHGFARKLITHENGNFSEEQIENLEEYANSIVLAAEATETEHQLQTSGLGEFSELCSDPTQLIHALYRERNLSDQGKLNLHNVVNDVAERHGVDLLRLRNNLLQRGLLHDPVATPEEKELYLPSMRVQLNNLLASSEERELQHQLLEIARSGSMQESIIYFVEFAYNGASSKIHTLHRIRCLLLVVQLASPEEIERYGKSYDEIRGYLQMLLYLLDFEELRIVQSIKEFDECDKEALARSLWLNHGGEAKVVQLICNLCLDYGIHDLSLWENALARLVQLGAIRYLAGIIDIVTTTPELSKMKNLPAVWNRVLIMCLEEVAARQDIYLFDRVLSLIQKCPYLYDLDLDTIVESVLSLDLLIEDAKDGPTSRAAQKVVLFTCLPPHPRVFLALKKVLSVLSSIELADMARLFTAGKYPDSMELAMFHIYMIIDERRDYGVLETEPALAKALVAQLMLLGGTGPLLEEMRKKGKHAEADGIEAMLETETF
ncbi:hypothetical protein CcCBS67573_g02645 [Chytriomyces confervae]|uniref:Uncharacterized protein n=1 Tax=Chytriomyces confervae TaxID=246404 RepID=A0A507FKD6_9FUNG|nr:hypothetical protein CcCBS67573_g02645 [Chytriomyces confervae]